MARILLIDDSESLLAHVTAMLRGIGHEVVAAARGKDVVAALPELSVDVILTDLYMPPPDGFEVIEAARAIVPGVPLIVMSTNPLAVDVFRAARALGAVAALQKPFSAEQLSAAINTAVLRPAAKLIPHPPTDSRQPFSNNRVTIKLPQ